MEYLTLKNSDLRVSRLCMGGCPMGGYGWGDVSQKELIAAIECAIDNGINFFDTADTYGLGQSEVTLSKGLGSNRHKVIIESKFGVRLFNGVTRYDNSPNYIKSALEGSLKRLNTDYIDVYVVHYRDGITPIEDVVSTLETLKEQGKIRYFGLSNVYSNELSEYLNFKGKFVCCQNEYSLACRKYENDLLSLSDNLDVTPLTWGSLGQGVLTGKYTLDTAFDNNDRRHKDIYVNFHGEKLMQNLKIVEEIKKISLCRSVSIPSVAIRFILDYLQNSVVLVGAKRPSQVISNIEAIGWSLNNDELDALNMISK